MCVCVCVCVCVHAYVSLFNQVYIPYRSRALSFYLSVCHSLFLAFITYKQTHTDTFASSNHHSSKPHLQQYTHIYFVNCHDSTQAYTGILTLTIFAYRETACTFTHTLKQSTLHVHTHHHTLTHTHTVTHTHTHSPLACPPE